MPGHNPKHKKSGGLPSDISKLGAGKLPNVKTGIQKKCQIDGCSETSIHTLSVMEYEPSVKKSGMKLAIVKGARRFNICKTHYKKIKGIKKKEDKILKPRFDTGAVKIPKHDKAHKFLE